MQPTRLPLSGGGGIEGPVGFGPYNVKAYAVSKRKREIGNLYCAPCATAQECGPLTPPDLRLVQLPSCLRRVGLTQPVTEQVGRLEPRRVEHARSRSRKLAYLLSLTTPTISTRTCYPCRTGRGTPLLNSHQKVSPIMKMGPERLPTSCGVLFSLSDRSFSSVRARARQRQKRAKALRSSLSTRFPRAR